MIRQTFFIALFTTLSCFGMQQSEQGGARDKLVQQEKGLKELREAFNKTFREAVAAGDVITMQTLLQTNPGSMKPIDDFLSFLLEHPDFVGNVKHSPCMKLIADAVQDEHPRIANFLRDFDTFPSLSISNNQLHHFNPEAFGGLKNLQNID